MVLLARKDEEGNTQTCMTIFMVQEDWLVVSRMNSLIFHVRQPSCMMSGRLLSSFKRICYRMMGIGGMCSMPVKGRLSSMIFSSRKGKLKR